MANDPTPSILSGLSPRRKSVLLAQAMGWRSSLVAEMGMSVGHYWLFEAKSPIEFHKFVANSRQEKGVYPNLYGLENMHLAWRVLNWAANNETWLPELEPGVTGGTIGGNLYEWFFEGEPGWSLPFMPAEKAQPAILDKILTLCIEAGLVDLPDRGAE